MARSLEDRLNDEPAPGWRPEKGEQIIGTIVEIGEAKGDYAAYPLITIETATGDIAVHAFHTVLRQELESKQPAEGDRIGIRYLGVPDDKDYESYRVVIERATPRATAPAPVAPPARERERFERAPARDPVSAHEAAGGWGDEEPF